MILILLQSILLHASEIPLLVDGTRIYPDDRLDLFCKQHIFAAPNIQCRGRGFSLKYSTLAILCAKQEVSARERGCVGERTERERERERQRQKQRERELGIKGGYVSERENW